MDDEHYQIALEVLRQARALSPDDPRFLTLEAASAHLRKAGKKKRRRRRRQQAAAQDRCLRTSSREGGEELLRERVCYVCKQPFRALHPVYGELCPACGETSADHRDVELDLSGRRALVTGGRIKIGFATATRLLRFGARVVVTTRFPADALRRFMEEPDSAVWRDHLEIHGLDFRDLPAVLTALEHWGMETFDILVNNAAQTVWRPPEAYRALLEAERRSEQAVTRWGSGDRVGQLLPLDLERAHSWVMALEEVPPVEMVECQVVNAIVPFLFCNRLKPALLRSGFPDRYVVNVTAVEGQFSREKLPRHPHTNMAKAALNMMTKTSAGAWAQEGIHMVAVDPGWVSHEGPPDAVATAFAQGWQPPLQMVDAACRILDPIARGLSGHPVHGVLLKDYRVVDW